MFHMILPQSDFLNYSQSNKCLPQRYSRQGFNSSSDNAGQSGCGMRAMCCWLPVTEDQKLKKSRPKESWNQNGKSISRNFFWKIYTNLNTYPKLNSMKSYFTSFFVFALFIDFLAHFASGGVKWSGHVMATPLWLHDMASII